MFEKIKARRAAEAAARAERGRAESEQQLEQQRQIYQWSIARVRSIADGSFADAPTSMALKRGERSIYAHDEVGLVESRKGPGHWHGASQGVSIRVPGTKSMRYRVGQTRGSYISGEERPTVIDHGSVVVTTTRAVFVGAKQTREWLWAKLVGFHDDDPGWIGLAVSNRQRVSGISYPTNEAVAIVIALQAAAAAANGASDQLVAELTAQLALPGPG
jgi:hypothetical protein